MCHPVCKANVGVINEVLSETWSGSPDLGDVAVLFDGGVGDGGGEGGAGGGGESETQ